MSGRLVLMGSGEMAPGLVATHRAGIEAAGAEAITVLDTPFGFQENADQLTERITEFFDVSLNRPSEVASLRLGSAPAVEVEEMVAAVRRSRYVFSGPGAPTHALRVWGPTRLADALVDVVEGGATVCFASAASLTLGTRTIPVYQIYKVGDPAHWHTGLGVTARLGLPMVVVPHWNNAEGGTHDTSRCYVGLRRLTDMAAECEEGILGIDEHTAATIDFGAGTVTVTGAGGISIIGPHGAGLGDGEFRVEAGASISLDELRDRLAAGGAAPRTTARATVPPTFREALDAGDAEAALAAILDVEASSDGDPARRAVLRSMLVDLGRAAADGLADPAEVVGPFVELLLALRTDLRGRGDYASADAVRDGLVGLDVEVRDTPEGTEWVLGGS